MQVLLKTLLVIMFAGVHREEEVTGQAQMQGVEKYTPPLIWRSCKIKLQNGAYKRSENYVAILQLKEHSRQEGRKGDREERKEERK